MSGSTLLQRPTRRIRVLGAALVATAAATIALALAAAPAQAFTAPLEINLGTVLPGQIGSAETTIHIPRAGQVAAAGWTDFSGPTTVHWESFLCTPAGVCDELSNFVGSYLTAGDYTLKVTIDMPEASAGDSPVVRALGELRLVDNEQGLALTGVDSGVLIGLGVAGVIVLATGAVLLFARRHKQDEDQS